MPPVKQKKWTSAKAGPRKRGKSRARRKGPSRALRVLAVMLVVVAVGGIAAVKFFQSPRGQAVLLERGLSDYYALVQENLDLSMRSALEEFGMRRSIGVSTKTVRMSGRDLRVLGWTVPCDEGTDFVLVNVALTNAAREAGGRVRSTEESRDGRTLIVHAGTRGFDTHRITLGKPSPRVSTGRPVPPPPPPQNEAESLPRVAIVIDDYGYTRSGVAVEMLEIDLPLTISVLPDLPQSAAMLERAQRTGHCTLLHLPMEAEEEDRFDIEPVTTAMSDEEITALVETYIGDFSGIDGVNNHQGSLATTDARVMRTVLRVIKRRDLFFLDSLTSPRSVAYNTAVELGVPAARNRIFLDDDTEDSYVVAQRLQQLVELAQTHGSAIGIGHPHRWTLEALLEREPYLKSAGVALVSVCAIVDLENSHRR